MTLVICALAPTWRLSRLVRVSAGYSVRYAQSRQHHQMIEIVDNAPKKAGQLPLSHDAAARARAKLRLAKRVVWEKKTRITC
jgi:hypothetical protein